MAATASPGATVGKDELRDVERLDGSSAATEMRPRAAVDRAWGTAASRRGLAASGHREWWLKVPGSCF